MPENVLMNGLKCFQKKNFIQINFAKNLKLRIFLRRLKQNSKSSFLKKLSKKKNYERALIFDTHILRFFLLPLLFFFIHKRIENRKLSCSLQVDENKFLHV